MREEFDVHKGDGIEVTIKSLKRRKDPRKVGITNPTLKSRICNEIEEKKKKVARKEIKEIRRNDENTTIFL